MRDVVVSGNGTDSGIDTFFFSSLSSSSSSHFCNNQCYYLPHLAHWLLFLTSKKWLQNNSDEDKILDLCGRRWYEWTYKPTLRTSLRKRQIEDYDSDDEYYVDGNMQRVAFSGNIGERRNGEGGD